MLKHLIAISLAISSLAVVVPGPQVAWTTHIAAAQSAADAKPIVLAQYNPCPNMRCR
jgi:hypothetical protein